MRTPHTHRWLIALLLAVSVGWPSAPAAAHTELVSSTPSAGPVDLLPAQVRLSFTAPISARLATVVVTSPRGRDLVVGSPLVDGVTVTATLARADLPGRYRVAFRVMSEDGHAVTGALALRVRAGTAAGSATERAIMDTPGMDAGQPSDSASPHRGISTPWVALGLVVLGLALHAAINAVKGRRRRAVGA